MQISVSRLQRCLLSRSVGVYYSKSPWWFYCTALLSDIGRQLCRQQVRRQWPALTGEEAETQKWGQNPHWPGFQWPSPHQLQNHLTLVLIIDSPSQRLFWVRDLLYSPGWPQTPDPSASTFPVLRLQVCNTTPGIAQRFCGGNSNIWDSRIQKDYEFMEYL
jgi:hypothetical protein